MKWTFSIKNRLAASMVLLALCLLVLLSNYLDRLHTENVKKSISTMYEDRLVVEEYILKMTRNVYQLREQLKGESIPARNNQTVTKLIQEFKTTFTAFSKTRLTKIENTTAVTLIGSFKELEQILSNDKSVSLEQTDKILLLLDKLSEIQLDESKMIMQQVEAQYATIKASSQLAFGIVIIILVVLQVLVFSGDTIIPLLKPKDPRLN